MKGAKNVKVSCMQKFPVLQYIDKPICHPYLILSDLGFISIETSKIDENEQNYLKWNDSTLGVLK